MYNTLIGASFGEVELLRADGSTAPRLATCRCLGRAGTGEGDCEALVMRGHMFSLLTDVFGGVRAKLGGQVMHSYGCDVISLKEFRDTLLVLSLVRCTSEYTLFTSQVSPCRLHRTKYIVPRQGWGIFEVMGDDSIQI